MGMTIKDKGQRIKFKACLPAGRAKVIVKGFINRSPAMPPGVTNFVV